MNLAQATQKPDGLAPGQAISIAEIAELLSRPEVMTSLVRIAVALSTIFWSTQQVIEYFSVRGERIQLLEGAMT